MRKVPVTPVAGSVWRFGGRHAGTQHQVSLLIGRDPLIPCSRND